MSEPRVSLILPTYNGGNYIGETLDSLLAQTFEDFELLIIDDGSTDETLGIISSREDRRIRLVRNAENLGIASTMNKAVKLAQGRYIARCDQDDVALPDRFAAQVAFLDAHPEIAVLGTSIVMFGSEYGDGLFCPLPERDADIKLNLMRGAGFIINPSVMYRGELVRGHGLRYDPTLFGCDDFGFWVDCVAIGARFANLPEPLMRYRWHATNTSKSDPMRHHSDAQRVRNRLLRLYFPALSTTTIERLVGLWSGSWPCGLAAMLPYVSAVAEALASPQVDYEQDQSGVRDALAFQLHLLMSLYAQRGDLRADHAETLTLLHPPLASALAGALASAAEPAARAEERDPVTAA